MFFYQYNTIKSSFKKLTFNLIDAENEAFYQGAKRYGKFTIEIHTIKKMGFRKYLSIIKVTRL